MCIYDLFSCWWLQKEMCRRLVVLYGSETGTAEDVARRVARECRRWLFEAIVESMDAYDRSQLVFQPAVVFICATTGQGEEPRNMRRFWKFLLRKSLPKDSLTGMQFSVFGLGDSSYPKYNYVAKKLHRRLLQLGGTALVPLSLGDDQHEMGYDAAVDPWLQYLFRQLLELFPLPPGLQPFPRFTRLPPHHRLVAVNSSSQATYCALHHSPQSQQNSPFPAHLLANKRVTSQSHFQDVRLITLNISTARMYYRAGDVLMVQPQNTAVVVDQFLSNFSLDPNHMVTIETTSATNFPTSLFPCSLHHLATHYLDFMSVPRRSFFELLATFASSKREKEKLMEFSSTEGQEDYYSYCRRPRRTILEVLADFPSAVAGFESAYLLDLIPGLKPRAFSIASSMSTLPGAVQILMAVVEYQTQLNLPRKGVCSTWLASLEPGDPTPVPIWIEPGSFSFPKQPHSSLIMVGPGTGCAPFRALLQERVEKGESANMLFFGCRSRIADNFFEEEWATMVSAGLLILYTAFSREQPYKVYVQNCIEREGEEVWKWLKNRNAYIYIAGNSKQMPQDVQESLQALCVKWGGLSQAEVQEYWKSLIAEQRVQLETWS